MIFKYAAILLVLSAATVRAQSTVGETSKFIGIVDDAGTAITIKVPGNRLYAVAAGADVVLFAVGEPEALIAIDIASKKELWRWSTRGVGPGEVMLPYRVRRDRDDFVLLDIGTKTLSWVDRAGKQIRRNPLGLDFSSVSDFAILSPDTVLIAGITADRRGAGAQLHLFAQEMRWIQSFARLPFSVDPVTSRLLGAGTVSLRGDTIMHSSPILSTVAAWGRPFTRPHVSIDVRRRVTPADKHYSVTATANGSVTRANPDARRLARAFAVGASTFFSVAHHDQLVLYRSEGSVVVPGPVVAGDSYHPADIDVENCRVLFVRRQAAEVMLRRLRIATSQPQRPLVRGGNPKCAG